MNLLNDLSDISLVCRDIRHSWGVSTQYVAPDRTLNRILVCQRCKTSRHDIFSWPSLDRLNTKYVYPDKYRLEKDSDTPRPSIRDFRSEWFRRHTPVMRESTDVPDLSQSSV